jgi:hypothetical protein
MNGYQQLDHALKTLQDARPRITYDIDEITNVDQIIELKQILETHGVVILKNAASDQSVRNMYQNISDCAENMFGLQSSTNVFRDLNEYRNPAHGFGNASFGYFFKQLCSKADTIETELNGDQIYLTENYGYQVNLKLLEDNPHTASVLLALTHPVGGMVSWDSFKLANNPKPKPKTMTKQTLTKCHFDAYGGGVNCDMTERFQAIVSIEDRIKLGYIPDSTHPDIKALIMLITKKKSLYDRDGFKSFSDPELLKVFSKYIIAPPSGALVLWKSGIIHYEAEFQKSGEIYRYRSSDNLSNQKRIRCIVGLHKPQNLTRTELIELARLAEHGLMPDMYCGINRDSKIYPNIMCSKSTQYKVYRKIPATDKKRLNKNIKSKDLSVLNRTSSLKKHLYGITQDIDDLEVSDVDKEMIRDSICSKSTERSIRVIKSTKYRSKGNDTDDTDDNNTNVRIKRVAPRRGTKRKAIARRAR